jgi:hypothetical protein
MRQLQQAGIYVIPGLASPSEIIFKTKSWDYILQNRFIQVLESLHKFENVIGYFLVGSPDTLPFVKAAVRELKTHIRQRGIRNIPIGYIGADRGTASIGDYLSCGEPNTIIDFYGIIPVPACSNSSEKVPFFQNMAARYLDYPIPTFLFNYTCTSSKIEELFSETQVLYGNNVTPIISGGLTGFFYQSRMWERTNPGES